MNGDVSNVPQPSEPQGRNDEALRKLLHWTKKLLWCNPFYLVSAAMLLYGIYRISIAPEFLEEDVPRLFASFGSLELYELLLVGTAIFLARRGIWYDSTLLVFLESGFVFVPLILVSPFALLVSGELTWCVCAVTGIAAAGRFASLRLYYPRLNLPPRLLTLGGALLVANVLLPLLFKYSHETHTHWLLPLSLVGWMLLMPALGAAANWLPRPVSWGGDACERSWLPLAILGLWVGVSCAHLVSLDYVFGIEWNAALLAPVVWVAAWTVVNRLREFLPNPSVVLRRGALLLPCAATALGFFHEDSRVLFAFSICNALVFGWLFLRNRADRFVYVLMLFSATATFASLPETLGRFVIPVYSREKCVLLATCATLIVVTALNRTMTAGILGALGVLAAVVIEFGHVAHVGHLGAQSACVFLLVHSLRWKLAEDRLAPFTRWMTSAVWVVDAVVWSQRSGVEQAMPVLAFSAVVLVGYFVGRMVLRRWGPKIIPITATIVVMSLPLRWSVSSERKISAGVLAMAASLLLFALGTLLALAKQKWNHHSNVPPTALEQ